MSYSSQDIWRSIADNRRFLLIATTTTLILLYLLILHFRMIVRLPFDSGILEALFEIVAIYFSWFSVITIISYGQHYLNRPHRWLAVINEGLYPFYILHQTAIIVIGYYVCKLEWSITLKFISVSMLTLASCLLIFFVLIRPFRLTRLMFGMKIPTARK